MSSNRIKSFPRAGVALLAAAMLAAPAARAGGEDRLDRGYVPARDTVQVSGGTIAAAAESGPEMRVFKAIPFAAPPLGALRWAAPAPVVPWSGIRRSDNFSPACWWGNRPAKSPAAILYQQSEGQSEDCLYLNVWTSVPAGSSAGAGRPVMMFLFGGGFQLGAGSLPNYDGRGLAEQGPVIVTLNYRLGPLGFLAHPALSAESPNRVSGNYALQDAIAALRWIQANIAQFGGDPANVTVYGESAGAQLSSVLVASPLAKGLFHKVVLESLGALPAGAPNPTLAQGEAAGSAFAANLGASGIADLRRLPAQDVMAGAGSLIGMLVDGYVLPDQLDLLFATRRVNDLPMLAGFNADEGTPYPPFATTLSAYNAAAAAQFGTFAAQFKQAYPVASDADVLGMAYAPFRDGTLAWGAWSMARAHAALRSARTYVYFFNRRPAYYPDQHFAEQDPPAKYGAYHSIEQVYFYNNLDRSIPPRPYTRTDREIAALASRYLVNFATHGDPNGLRGRGLPYWPAFADAASLLMYIGDRIEPGPVPFPAGFGFYDAFYAAKLGRPLPF